MNARALVEGDEIVTGQLANRLADKLIKEVEAGRHWQQIRARWWSSFKWGKDDILNAALGCTLQLFRDYKLTKILRLEDFSPCAFTTLFETHSQKNKRRSRPSGCATNEGT